jgi:hypothetical protein
MQYLMKHVRTSRVAGSADVVPNSKGLSHNSAVGLHGWRSTTTTISRIVARAGAQHALQNLGAEDAAPFLGESGPLSSEEASVPLSAASRSPSKVGRAVKELAGTVSLSSVPI